MKIWLSVVLLLAGVAYAGDIEEAKKLTVLVTNEGFLGGGKGSGILLDDTHVLTCAHMADSMKDEFFVYTYPFGVVVKAHIESYNASSDLLLLKLEMPVKVSKAPIFQPATLDGESVTVLGNALGAMKWYVTRGIISGHERDYILTDAHINHGNSGGPWFNEKGEIVGLSDWGLEKNETIRIDGVSGGVSAQTVLDTLKSWQTQKKGIAALLRLLEHD